MTEPPTAGRRGAPADDLPMLPPRAFAKLDDAADDAFYRPPRFVTHIDDGAIAAVTELYRELAPPGGALLDLMSSWVSHLPAEIVYRSVIGHGMNAQELAANPRLDRWFVQDLNREARLPLAAASLDAVLVCVSIQYLQQPVAALREVARALKPGAPVIISFSNRCFPSKAVAIWRALAEHDRSQLVARYLEHAGFGAIEARQPRALPGADPLWAVIGRATS